MTINLQSQYHCLTVEDAQSYHLASTTFCWLPQEVYTAKLPSNESQSFSVGDFPAVWFSTHSIFSGRPRAHLFKITYCHTYTIVQYGTINITLSAISTIYLLSEYLKKTLVTHDSIQFVLNEITSNMSTVCKKIHRGSKSAPPQTIVIAQMLCVGGGGQ